MPFRTQNAIHIMSEPFHCPKLPGIWARSVHLECTRTVQLIEARALSPTDEPNTVHILFYYYYYFAFVQFSSSAFCHFIVFAASKGWPFSAFKFKLNMTYLVFVSVYVLASTPCGRDGQKRNSYCYRLISHFSFT